MRLNLQAAWIGAAFATAAALPVAAEEAPAPAPSPAGEPARAEAPAAPADLKTPREATPAQELLTGRDLRVDIRVADAPLTEVLRSLQAQTDINFVATADVTSEIRVRDVHLVSIPWRDALRVVLQQTEAIIEEETPRMVRIGRPPRVSMEFRNAPLSSVLDTIAKVSGANIIIASQVQGNVTGRFKNIPWNSALDSVVKTAGFATVREDDKIIRVVDPKQLQAQLEVKAFQLKYLTPPPKYSGSIKSPYASTLGGTQQAAASTGGVPADIAGFTLLNIVRNILSKDAAGKDVGKLEYDKNTSTLIVTDTKPVIDKIAEIIKQLDVEPLQVLIDVNFVATRNEDLLTLGNNFALGTDEGLTFTTQALPPATVPSFGSDTPARIIRPFQDTRVTAATGGLGAGRVSMLPFGFGHERPVSEQLFLTKYDFVSTLRIFQKDKFSKVIQRPSIAALNNQEATIFVGEEIRYAETKAASSQSGGTTFEISEASKSPVKVGFQLLVIPNIVPDSRKIKLTVIPQNEVLSGDPSTAGGKVKGFERFIIAGLGPGGSTLTIDLPRIRSTTVVTSMLLEDGQTSVIGGLVQDETGKTVTKLPLLGDIPVLGYLFKQTQDSTVKENLFIFITPRIVRSAGETQSGLDAALKSRADAGARELESLRSGNRAAEQTVSPAMEERRKQGEAEFDSLQK
jgi:type IV pilus assembly protein PilQ